MWLEVVLTHLRISCAPMPSWSVYLVRVSWMRLLGACSQYRGRTAGLEAAGARGRARLA
jgi:hypothetical protein